MGGPALEDKLTHDERLRLEALNQAVQHNQSIGGPGRASAEKVTSDAKAFEGFIRGGRDG